MCDEFFRCQVLRSATSTNDLVKQAIEAGEGEGMAFRAYEQTAGYGRQGRVWKSPRGGMYESVLLRPQVDAAQLPTLALVAALAVRHALASLVTDDQAALIAVKWPNDVVVLDTDAAHGATYQKLAGISSEVHQGAVCIGIGVNVNPPIDLDAAMAMTDGAKNAPIYLTELGYGMTCEFTSHIDIVGDAVLAELGEAYQRWVREGFAAFIDEFNDVSMLRGRHVRMENLFGDIACEGTVVGMDASGRLEVRQADGSTQAVSSGEVHIV